MSRAQTRDGASVDSGRTLFVDRAGRWAGEQMLRALKEGRVPTAADLRTLDTLSKDEWIAFDLAVVEEGMIRLRAVADLVAAGLTRPVANGLGKTVFQYEKITDLGPAQVSMSGMSKTEQDRQEFELNNLPMPIVHKDFYLDLRTLSASRERGESLDTTQARTAGRVVAEKIEELLFLGGPTFGSIPIYGYLTHPDRNEVDFDSNETWTDAAKTGEEILKDVLSMISAAEADRMFGPYWLYVPAAYGLKLEEDFKANSDKTIRQRLEEISQIGAGNVKVVDQLTADNVVLVQRTSDVVVLVQGEPMQTVQWDIEGGFNIRFKAFTIQVPLIRSDASKRSGVVHLHQL